ncbi:hypothetical protein LCGC14_0266960 [marine sediment metagenome]|uniref:Uncharacterized protein n=1 Tax=marine sediment metagenome TaxID=412755 RepID=A0A0F9TZT3_9ZZZZ
MTQRTLSDSIQDEQSYCGLCRKPTDDFYEKKLAGKDACLNCAILITDYGVETEHSMYTDSYLNQLESTSATLYASEFKYAMREHYFFTDQTENIDPELFEVLYHFAKKGIEVKFKSFIALAKFISKHATDKFSGQRAKMVSSILVRGLEQNLTRKQRYVIQRTISIVKKFGDYPTSDFI